MNQTLTPKLGALSLFSLLRWGGILAFVQAASVIFAVIGFFIWPHVFTDAEAIFIGIQANPAGYFMKLDPIVLFGTLLQLPVWLALWAALRGEAPAGSLIALAFGALSTVSVLPTRPLIELYTLSSLHAAATGAAQQAIYVAAGEALLAQFHGTAWAISIMAGGVAGLMFGWMMWNSTKFRRITAIAMITAGAGALPVLIPIIGILFLFLLATIGGVIASMLTGLDLIRIVSD